MTTLPLSASIVDEVVQPQEPVGAAAAPLSWSRTASASGRWWLLAGLVLLLSGATSLLGLSTLALESHEVYVARTVEEMQSRSQWLVPVFNETLRLKKPPMMYWLVMGADAVAADGPFVSEAAARAPSAVAGMMVVLLTMMIGRRLFGPVEGLLAGLVLTASSGMFSYAHSARPEMVYALWCHAALLCFVSATQAIDERRDGHARWWTWSAWAALGLATLTKGPQLPAMIVVGWAIGLAITGRRGAIVQAMRPWSGLAILLLVGAWWYVAVWLSQPGAIAIWQAETLDRFSGERSGESLWMMLEPYYLYRTGGLLLPWIALYALGLASPWIIRSGRQRVGVQWMWWIVVIAMIGLSLSLGRRWYYMLPVVGPLALLGVVGALEVGRRFWKGRQRGVVAGVIIAHVAAVAMYEFWVHFRDDDAPTVNQWAGAFVIALVAGLAGGWLFAQSRKRRATALPILLTVMLVVGAIFFIDVALDQQVWRDAREEQRVFGQAVAQTIGPREPILGWGDDWPIQQYYLHRPIHSAAGDSQVMDAVQRDGGCWLLVDSHRRPAPSLSTAIESWVVLTCEHEGTPDRLQLWRVGEGHERVIPAREAAR